MSERGSFITEYCYCPKCFEVLKAELLGQDKWLCSQVLTDENGAPWPIIAGKIGGTYSGNETCTFWYEIGCKIAKKICHPVRIAVLCDNGPSDEIFVIEPGQTEEKVLKKYSPPYNGEWPPK